MGFPRFPGYHLLSPNGVKSGYGYEYLQKIALYAGWSYEYIGYDLTWEEAMAMLEAGQIDLLTAVRKSPERLEKFDFAEHPVGSSHGLLTVRAGESRFLPGDYANWNGMRVGMTRVCAHNSAFENFAKEHNFQYQPIFFSDQEALLQALDEGEVDASVSTSLRTLSHEWVYATFATSPFYAVVRKGDQELLHALDNAIEELNTDSPGFQSLLLEKYFSPRHNTRTAFSAKERAYIAQAQAEGRKYRAILCPDRTPLSFAQEGTPGGILAEISREILQRTGLEIQIVTPRDRKEYQQAIFANDTSIILDAPYDYTIAEERNYTLTDPYFSASFSILRRKDLNTPARTFAVIRNSQVWDLFHSWFGNDIQTTFYDSSAEIIDAIVNRKQDAAYLYTPSAELAVFEDHRNLLASDLLPASKPKFAIGVKNFEDPRLATILNKAVAGVPQERIDAIRTRHAIQPIRKFSLLGYLYTNPLAALGAPFGAFFIVILFLSIVLIARRNAYRKAVVIRKLPLRYFVIDSAGNILDYSWETSFREKQKLNTLKKFRQLLSPAVADLVQSTIAHVIATGKTETVHFQANAQKRSATVTKLPYALYRRDAAVWVSQDTTEIQNMQAEARSNAKRFHLTLQSIADGVIATDLDEKITMVNPVAAEMLEVPAEKLLNQKLSDFFRIVHFADGRAAVNPVTQALASGNAVELTQHTDLITDSGKRYHIADSAAPIRDENGNVEGAVLVFRDITGEYERNIQLQRTMQALEYASELTSSAAFQYSVATRTLSGTGELENLWPAQNGVALPLEDWIHSEDIAKVKEAFAQMRLDDTDTVTVTFRTQLSEQTRYLRIKAGRDRSVADDSGERLSGVIQDITEITETAGELRSSREMRDAVLNSLPFVFFAKDIKDQFRYVLANHAMEEFLHNDRIVGKLDSELWSNQEDLERIQEQDLQAAMHPQGMEFFEEVYGADQKKHFFRTVKKPFHSTDGHALLLGISADVTELHDFAQHEKILNACMAAVLSEDADPAQAAELLLKTLCEYLQADRCHISTYDLPDQSMNMSYEYRAPGAHPAATPLAQMPLAFNEAWYQSLLDGRMLILPELRSTTAEQPVLFSKYAEANHIESLYSGGIYLGKSRWGNLSVFYERRMAPLNDRDLKLIRACANLAGIMLERNRNRREILAAMNQAQAADKAKSFFIASVSHEIRTPLNAVIGFAEILRDGKIPPATQKEYLDAIAYSGNALLQLINDVLDLSKLEAHQMVITPNPTDVSALCLEVLGVFKHRAAEKSLELKLSQEKLPTLWIDKLRVRQILFNLLGNAVKFTEQGHVKLHARFIPDSPETGMLQFEVHDTGMGISPEEQSKLMEPFVQATHVRGTQTANNGTGLGLAISKRMTETMNGELTLASELGSGSVFTVRLRQIHYEWEDVTAPQATPISLSALPVQSLLIVDDVPMNLRVLEAMLNKLQVRRIRAASGGREALELLGKESFDLVLTDMWMPEMNGEELARQIKERFPAMPIIAVTADADPATTFETCIFNAILTKPISMEKLQSLLQQFGKALPSC